MRTARTLNRICIATLVTVALNSGAQAQKEPDKKKDEVKRVISSKGRQLTKEEQEKLKERRQNKIEQKPTKQQNVAGPPQRVEATRAKPVNKAIDNDNGPLSFDSLDHDFGSIPDTDAVEHSFVFTNNTEKSLRITARGSCGCTVPRLAKAVYAPGEVGEITAKFNPKRRNGNQVKTIRVQFPDEGDMNDMQLTIRAQVEALITMQPNKVYLREVPRDEGATERVVVTGRLPNFEITKVTTERDDLKVTIGERTSINEDGKDLVSYELTIDVPSGTPIGRLTDKIMIETNDTRVDAQQLMVNADVVGALRASPPRMYVRSNLGEKAFQTQARLDSRDGRKFEIVSLDVDSPQGTIIVTDFQEQPQSDGSVYLIKVSGVTPDVVGNHQGEIIVKTSLDSEAIRIPLVANVRKAQANAAR